MKTAEIKEPIKIRLKELKNGNKSIYLDYYLGNGRREYKFLNLYLHPNKSKEDKEWNKRQMQLANAVKAQHIIRIQNKEHGFQDASIQKKLKFIDYCKKLVDEYKTKGQRTCAILMEYAIERLTRYKGKDITFGQIDKDYLIGFIDFINNDFRIYNTRKTIREKKKISEEYKIVLFGRVMTALNRAARDGIIVRNPGMDIDSSLKPKHTQKGRCYLTIEEIQSIIQTPYHSRNNIKEAFLFCCFCGLRFSDVQKMKWKELKYGQDGLIQLETTMKKTRQELYLPLSDNAIKWLPERGDSEDNDLVFSSLPRQACHANQPLKTLIKKAGIKKHVTFHVARHTFATLTLSYGADLYTVSKLLGHRKVQTTQIYAKIIDENKRKAVNLIPKL